MSLVIVSRLRQVITWIYAPGRQPYYWNRLLSGRIPSGARPGRDTVYLVWMTGPAGVRRTCPILGTARTRLGVAWIILNADDRKSEITFISIIGNSTSALQFSSIYLTRTFKSAPPEPEQHQVVSRSLRNLAREAASPPGVWYPVYRGVVTAVPQPTALNINQQLRKTKWTEINPTEWMFTNKL